MRGFAVPLALSLTAGMALGLPVSAGADPAPPSAPPHLTASEVAVEIDRVVAEGTSKTVVGAERTLGQDVAAMVRCAEFSTELRYCLHYGWTKRSEGDVQDEVAKAVAVERAAAGSVEETGDLSWAEAIERLSETSTSKRTAAERTELDTAAASIQAALDVQPESGVFEANGLRWPHHYKILPNRVREQTTTYWCGPASMQMIHWNWGSNPVVSQATWANRLNTTGSGTAITDMTLITNLYTHWDLGGPLYNVYDVQSWSILHWYNVLKGRIYDFERPVILHPVLLKQYFPYLDDNGSGHFQVGRGYDDKGGAWPDWVIGYYEPWNQKRFNPSEPYIARKQWRKVKNSYDANRAHFQHNIGL